MRELVTNGELRKLACCQTMCVPLSCFGEKSLRNATLQFVEHYHTQRNHQGLDNTIIDPGPEVGQTSGEVVCDERLGGLLNYYHRRAA